MLHFVAFDRFDQRYWNAVRAFGAPAFLHRRWDQRAQREIKKGDLVVMAHGNWGDAPSQFNGDDEYYEEG